MIIEAMADQPTAIVGVLGGMGPDATVDFMSTVISLTEADKDQDHVHMIVDHNPHVPDRQAALLGDGCAVSDALVVMAKRLEAAGADFLVMPCNTAQAFAQKAAAAVEIPFLDIVEETVGAIESGINRVGLLATTACLRAGMYQPALKASGRSCVLPTDAEQDRLMQLVFLVKSADQGDVVCQEMLDLAHGLVKRGAQAVVAGCTEIPLVLRQEALEVALISSTQVLAARTVELATGSAR